MTPPPTPPVTVCPSRPFMGAKGTADPLSPATLGPRVDSLQRSGVPC